jgi:hypothetical protein
MRIYSHVMLYEQTSQGGGELRAKELMRRAKVEDYEMHENCTLGQARATV